MAAGEDGSCAVCFFAGFAVFAGVTDILNGLVSRSLAHFVVLDSIANLDNHARTLVSCTFSTEFGHLGEVPVIQHEMDVRKTETGSIELYKDLIRFWQSQEMVHWHGLEPAIEVAGRET